MEIQFKTELQKHIADLLWEADDMDKVESIIKVYGTDGRVVYDMIMAKYIDDETETDLAMEVLNKIMAK